MNYCITFDRHQPKIISTHASMSILLFTDALENVGVGEVLPKPSFQNLQPLLLEQELFDNTSRLDH